MPPPTRAGFGSLTTRLIVWILLACGGILLATLRLSNRSSRATAEQVAEREAEAEARRAIDLIGVGVQRVEDGTRALARTLETLQPSDAELDALLRRFLVDHPRVFGTAAAFAPGGWRPGLEHFAPYVYRAPAPGSELARKDLAADDYRYFEKDWFTRPLRTRQAGWSEPYLDEGGGGVRMVTYSVPILRQGPEGTQVRGVVTSDLTLEWLNEAVQDLASGDARALGGGAEGSRGLGGRVAILSRDGIVLAARDKLWLGEPLVDHLEPGERSQVEQLLAEPADGTGLHAGRVGSGDDLQLVRWIEHPGTGWRITVLYPAREVYASVEQLTLQQGALDALGLALLAVVVVVLSRRLTRPLAALTTSAAQLATGDLDAVLPEVRSRDEVGRLTLAFREMRDSLKAYIQDLAETTKKKERLESELRAARKIQMAMLPKAQTGGRREGYELAAALVPARDVGGDLYDHFAQDTSVFFLVGDVSGKGVPAALFMARAKMLFETVAARETDPGAILRRLNRGLAADNEAGMFVTVVCGSLDTRTGELAFACGGHESPVHVTLEQTASLDAAGGPLIGLLPDADFPVNTLRLAPGEAIVMFTDGVSEAANAAGDMLGSDRLLATLARLAGSETPAITEGLLGAVREFAGEAPQSDDITILTLRYLRRQDA